MALPCPLLLPVPKAATDRPRGLGRRLVRNQAMSPPPPGRQGPSDDLAPSSGKHQHPPRRPGKAWPAPQGTPSPAPTPATPQACPAFVLFPIHSSLVPRASRMPWPLPGAWVTELRVSRHERTCDGHHTTKDGGAPGPLPRAVNPLSAPRPPASTVHWPPLRPQGSFPRAFSLPFVKNTGKIQMPSNSPF